MGKARHLFPSEIKAMDDIYDKVKARARARQTDPPESHAAARDVNVTENQRAVLTIMRLLGRPILDEELVREYLSRYRALSLPRQSESGLRSRRSELAKAGKLVMGESRRMTTGRLGRTWSIGGP